MQTWQPIETIPKTADIPFLICTQENECMIVYYHKDEDIFRDNYGFLMCPIPECMRDFGFILWQPIPPPTDDGGKRIEE